MNHQFYPVLCADADYVLTSLAMIVVSRARIRPSSVSGNPTPHLLLSPRPILFSERLPDDAGGHVSVIMIRDLAHVVDREKAKIGLFITLAEPTKPMQTEAVKTGFFETPYGKYPKIQILTIAELFAGAKPNTR
jgi:hypothetical protein